MTDILKAIIENHNINFVGKTFPSFFASEGGSDLDDLPNVFQGLIPTVAVVIGTVISLLIVFWIISYFVYFPVKDIVEKRSNKIRTDLVTAEKLNTEASKSLKRAQSAIHSSKNEATEIVAKSIGEASFVKNEIITTAKSKAETIVEQARTQIVHEQKEAEAQINDEIAKIAMLAATKIIEKEINPETNKKLINDLINELGK